MFHQQPHILILLAMNDNTRSRSTSQAALKCEALTGIIPKHLSMFMVVKTMVVKTLKD